MMFSGQESFQFISSQSGLLLQSWGLVGSGNWIGLISIDIAMASHMGGDIPRITGPSMLWLAELGFSSAQLGC
ncbi:hypothetical protein LINPERPRIM_LOCUS6230 [Linum perenne]